MVSIPKANYPAIVVGAGMAGVSIAYHLGVRGLSTLLLESKAGLAEGASGNPAGLASLYITKFSSNESRISLKAHNSLLKFFARSEENDPDFPSKVSYKRGIFFKLSEEARYLSGIEWMQLGNQVQIVSDSPWSKRPSRALYFPEAVCYYPRSFLSYLTDSIRASLAVHTQEQVLGWEELENSEPANLRVITNKGSYTTDALFLALGSGFTQFSSFQDLPLQLVRGQVEVVQDLPALPPQSIVFGKYLTADLGQGRLLGASYNPRSSELGVSEEDSEELFQAFGNEFLQGVQTLQKGIVGIRTQTKDRRPLLGRLRNSNHVYFLGGLGSRGLNLGFFLGEELVRLSLEEKNQLTEEELQSISPLRFFSKNQK